MHDGQYVVRAAIAIEGKILATGLSADANVQIAEDRARERAIAAIGILVDEAPSLKESTDTISSHGEQVTADASASALTPEAPVEIPALPITLPDTDLEAESADDLGLSIDEVADEPAAVARSSAATKALKSFDASVHPVDLSDIIAQTDVELTRLGWTNVQGRQYLEKTYGKRSRTQLTDEELMSFLVYLADQ